MKQKKWMKVILIGSCLLALTACSHKNQGQSAVNAANSAYSSGNNAEASGLGDESEYGAEGGGSARALSQRVYLFDYDSNYVREQDKPAIIANANYLASHANAKVMLEGHTDPRGSREYNIGLGERRAKAVAMILTSHGVSPSQISVVSYGAEKLAAVGRTESAYQQDRRVALVYFKR